MLPWLFLIFRDKWNGAGVILQKCPWKPIYIKLGYYTNQGYLMGSKFWAPHYLMWFQVQNVFGQIWPRKPFMKSLPTPRLDMTKQTDLAWRFLRTNKNSPLKNPLFGCTVLKICMICMFRCADKILLWKWLKMNVGKSKMVWSGNDRCHMSQEGAIKSWVALRPTLPDWLV